MDDNGGSLPLSPLSQLLHKLTAITVSVDASELFLFVDFGKGLYKKENNKSTS